jgi:hypothetical protein
MQLNECMYVCVHVLYIKFHKIEHAKLFPFNKIQVSGTNFIKLLDFLKLNFKRI